MAATRVEEQFLITDPDGVIEPQIITGRDSLRMALDAGFKDSSSDDVLFDEVANRDTRRANGGYGLGL